MAVNFISLPLDRRSIEASIEALVSLLNVVDGDPDVEANGDELDGSSAEEDIPSTSFGFEPGCPIADPGEYALPEGVKQREYKQSLPHEDFEDDDQDQCLAADDDPARHIRDGYPGDSFDTELNGDEGDYSDGDCGHVCHCGVDQTRRVGPGNPAVV